ncbi:cap-specific mRNA (nucleoside-2'-O-)-methyltransferase 1-like isoform X2 [Ruditapes philippinarum]|uniref:cap-specific mRNA (nucleoside-2'-O-)-methyltransferase 1-like isoform X2 n=1 Tax=Ruditapes philippinarum TaxID=129788 RepID=UPI00295B3C23|nr:cap-specific mRNA (nucleoside-2'-O-)-methyltransferase 1-like isoform X2 [Ruditapes philippinarum]
MASSFAETTSESDSDEDPIQPPVKKLRTKYHDSESDSDSDPIESPVKKQRTTYNPHAEKMMAKMSNKAGTGLGKNAQGLSHTCHNVPDDRDCQGNQPTIPEVSQKRLFQESDSDSDPIESPVKKQRTTYNPHAEKMMAKMSNKAGTGEMSRKRFFEESDNDGEPIEPPVKKPHTQYNAFAEKMMAKMGYKEGKGLGKNAQGRVNIVEASMQRGRRGLGLTLKGLEPSMEADWNEEDDQVIIDEVVEWLPCCEEAVPSIEVLRNWKTIGPKKLTLDNETQFCTENTLEEVLSSKSIFDRLEPEEMRKARTRSNPYETIRGAFFLNRAAMKMANMDAVLDFMFTNPKYPNGRPMVGPNDLLYFADICAGPGGFSEYVLWRTNAEAKGFGMTLKGSCDFKLEDFFAGPPEMFEPHYGVGGIEGDGDIFRPENQQAFIQFVKDNTDNQGVHVVMADGGFSVEGQENIQEILSKQLYLCQFLVAVSILRTGGHFVCKLFDLFTPFSVGLVYLMYRIFEGVSIFKPVTSRPANSERYIICKSLRKDCEPVRQYFHEINLNLSELLRPTSDEDLTDIVPMSYLQNNEAFYEYICVSNDSLGKLQILNLQKIRVFTQNTNLYETRQKDVRATLLKKWQVDDEVRTAPAKSRPQEKIQSLLGNDDMSYFDHVTEKLSVENLRTIKGVYDYRCMVTGDNPDKHMYILSLGRSSVFQRQCRPNARWTKMEDGLKIELPRDTLIEAEIVIELRGEGTGQRKITTMHALDALFLYGKDVRKLHFIERIQKLRKFAKAITKLTRSDLVRLVVPEVFRFEEIGQIFSRLKLKRVKGGGQFGRLCYCPKDNVDERFFRPTGIHIIRTVKEPWTMQWSRSQKRKYFFNLHNGESKFDCPPDSIANVKSTKLQSFHWAWEEGVKLIEDQQGDEDDSKLSKANVMDYLHRLLPPT